MVSFVYLDTGAVLGLVAGRACAAVRGWLLERPRWWWRAWVVAIDPSAAFRKAVKPLLQNADVAVDHWHLVKLGNDALTRVRRSALPSERHRLSADPTANGIRAQSAQTTSWPGGQTASSLAYASTAPTMVSRFSSHFGARYRLK